MTETPDETETETLDWERHYIVELIAHPYARDPLEAYAMAVDVMIRTGTDNFHPVITDVESGERWLMTPDHELVTGVEIQETLERLSREFAEQQHDAAQ